MRQLFLGSVAALLVCAGAVTLAQTPVPASAFVAVSPNTNVLRGITDSVRGDAFLQRQNEPAVAVSTRNPNHIMIAANDYRTVDLANDVGLGESLTRLWHRVKEAASGLLARVTGRREFDADGDEEIEKVEAGAEAWIGLYLSNDGGKSYSNFFMPGYPQDSSTVGQSTPAFGHQAASDPVLTSAPAGRFYLGSMVFNRDPVTKKPTYSQVVVSQFTDLNNSETGQNFHFDRMTLIDDGSVSGRRFLDKPSIVADIARLSSDAGACGPVYIAYTVFDERATDPLERSKILVATSLDCGERFSTPTRISHRSVLNQGVSLAVRPSDGALFAAYRSFSEKKMYVAYSLDSGRSFTQPQVVSGPLPLLAFDQPTLGASDGYAFRTNAFPTIAIDGSDKIFVAWQERLVADGNPRIVITSSSTGKTWTAKHPVEESRSVIGAGGAILTGPDEVGPQIMPTLSFSRGRLMLLFYEARPHLDVVKFVASQNAKYITGLDAQLNVRVATLDANGFGASVFVSRYETDKNGNVVPLISRYGGVEYRAANRPNLPMYAGGLSAFLGDYIALAPTMPFVPANASAQASAAASNTRLSKPGPFWRWATQPTDAPSPAFLAAWGDNRDVVFPKDVATQTLKIDGPWSQYGPPGAGACINPGSRNANVYSTFVSPRLIAGTPTSFKDLGIQRAFVLFVQNQTSDRKFYRLSIVDSPPGVNATFQQIGADQNTLDIEVFPLSTVTENVFAIGQSGAAAQTFRVDIAEITETGSTGAIVQGGDAAAVVFNSDQSNPQLIVADATSEFHSPRIFTPGDPTSKAPRISNPQVANPQVANPQVANQLEPNPQVANPQVANPQVANLQLTNVAPTDPTIEVVTNVTNYTWQVANVGNTASAFAPIFNIANQSALEGKRIRLFIYKTYKVPTFATVNGVCVATEVSRDQIVSVIENPQVANPQVANPQVANPQVANPQVANATFFIAPSDAGASSTATTASGQLGSLALAALAPIPPVDDGTLPVVDAPTLITLQIQSGDTFDFALPPPPPAPGLPPPAFNPPLTLEDFADGDAVLAITATSNDVIKGVVQAIPEAVTTGPDLKVSVAPTINVTPNAAVPAGAVVTFSSFTVKNDGDQESGPFTYGFYLSATAQIDPATATLLGSGSYQFNIAPGATATLLGGTFTIPANRPPGPYFLGVRINNGNPATDPTVFEPEDNDSNTIPITLGPGANLVIDQFTLTPATLFAGQTTTASVTVKNAGTAPAGASTLTFFLSNDAALSGNDTPLGTVATPPLAAGASAIVSPPLVIPSNTAGNSYSVIIVLDSPNAVPESNEADNTATAALQIAKSNLNPTLSFQPQPSTAIAGHAIVPAVQVKMLDSQNLPIAGALVQMSLGSCGGTGTGTLSGTTGVNTDAAGVAAFSNVKISLTGTYCLAASVPTLGVTTPVASNLFTVMPNATPSAAADAYNVQQGGTLTVAAPGVLGNDSDGDGDSLTAVIVSGVAHGQLTLNPNGSFSYTPTAAYSGPDGFVYRASDGIADSANAAVSITVTPVTPSADVSVSQSHAPATPTVGNNLTYTITVANAGPSPATNVTLTDTLPGSVAFISATPGQGSCNEASGTVTCALGSLASGANTTVTMVVLPSAAQPITNVAVVSAPESDPVSTNNQSSEPAVVAAAGPCVTPTFSFNIPDETQVTATFLATGDFDKDGHLDVAVSEGPFGLVRVFLADVANPGTFNHTDYFVSGSPGGLVVRDFDGDGNLDIAVASSISNTISFLKGSASGTFAAPVTTAVSTGPLFPEAADFNGDGRPDLAVGFNNSTSISILLWDTATGKFANPVSYSTGPSSGLNIIIEDFDGNGTRDIATANVGMSSFTILSGNGNGTFTAQPAHSLPYPIQRLRKVGDVNGDNRPDLGATLRVTNTTNLQNLALLFNTGVGFGFGSPVQILPESYAVVFFALGDVTGDGKPDLVANTNQNALASILVMNGDGTGNFGVPPTQFLIGQQNSFEIVDVNGDGKLDVIGVGPVSDTFYLLQNSCGTATSSDLSLTMTGPAAAAAGDNVTYTLTVTNNGPSAATNLFVNDFLGAGLTYVDVTSDTLTCDTQDSTVACWSETPFASGATATIDITARAFSGAQTNRAMAYAYDADPNNANSNAAVTTTVPAAALTFVVTNTNDIGAGSLKQAITDSNLNAGPSGSPNAISFNIPGPGPTFTIAPAQTFITLPPTITNPVVIDGTTQRAFMGNPCAPGAACPPVIEFSGVNIPNGNGLVIQTNGSTVRGLAINRWSGGGTGILLNTSAGGNVIAGNYIGTDVSGTTAAGNGTGIRVLSPNNIIGGTTAAERNVISGNGTNGITITGITATGNQVAGNFVGTTAAGTGPLGNSGVGVSIGPAASSSSNNTIGGVSGGNLIAFNAGRGVVVNSGVNNRITGNSILSNGSLGIDLGNNGVTANDIGDGDTGANNLQNYPVLTQAIPAGVNVTIGGTFNSNASSTYDLDFFASPSCDTSGFGQGAVFLGSAPVTTDGSGNVVFFSQTFALPSGVTSAAVTATDSAGNTSEFSRCVAISAGPPVVTTTSLPSATINVPYSQQLAVSGATGAVVWTLNTNNSPLLSWLSVSSAGVLSGTPPNYGTTPSFTVIATDALNQIATSGPLTIFVGGPLNIIPTTLREGVVLENPPPLPLVGGTGTRTVTLTSGNASLPPGLSLLPSGSFSGSPTRHGTFTFTVQVTDSGSPQQSVTRTLTMRVSARDQQGNSGSGGAIPFGGAGGRKIAQTATVGSQGTLTGIGLRNVSCPTSGPLTIEIQRLTLAGLPDGTTIASGVAINSVSNASSVTNANNAIAVSPPVDLPIDARVAFIVSSPTPCTMTNTNTLDQYNAGDAYVDAGAGWVSLFSTDTRYDIPSFVTLIQPAIDVAYLTRGHGSSGTATLLNNGKVLLAGTDNTAELYDPATNTATQTAGNMSPAQRFDHAAALLADGTVLVVGGRANAITLSDPNNPNNRLDTADIFDPATGTFTPASGPMSIAREFPTATTLANGKVLVTGGAQPNGITSSSADLYDPVTKTFSPTGNTMTQPRQQHAAILLPSGKVLLVGGFGNSATRADIFDPATGLFTQTAGSMQLGNRGRPAAALLNDGRVLITGGQSGEPRAEAEIYSPAVDSFTATGSMASRRFTHTATTLADGSVLVAGGFDQIASASYILGLATMERYIPASGTFVPAGGMETRRQSHTATRLQSDKILLAGGGSQSWMTADTADVYDLTTIPVLTTTALPNGVIGTPYGPVTLTAGGGSGAPYQIAQVSGQLPPGINYNAGSFTLSGTPTADGLFTVGFRVTDSAIHTNTQTLSIRIGTGVVITSPFNLTNGAQNHPYSYQLTATGTGAISWSLAPATTPPAGLSVGSTGLITGTPTSTQGSTFIVRAVDATGQSAYKAVNISIGSPLVITTTSLPEGVVLESNTFCLSSSNAIGAQTWTVTTSSPAPGFALQSNGCNAAPTATGTFGFTAQVTDSASPPQVVTQAFNIRVSVREQLGGSQTQSAIGFGGAGGRKIAQVVTVGAQGTLNAIGLQNISCPSSTPVTIDIQRLTLAGLPNSTTIATGTASTGYQGIAIAPPIPMAIDERFAFIVSSPTACTFTNAATIDEYQAGDAYADAGGGWVSLFSTDGRYDVPSFRTLIQPAASVSYLNRSRGGHTETLLPNGKVLFTGNDNTAELYDPATNTATLTGSMSTQRFSHTATLLLDGTVLVVGGRDFSGNRLATAEVYNPSTGAFSATNGLLATARENHTATRLGDGRVLITGGFDTQFISFASAEIYDPITKTFSATGNMTTGRHVHTATLLQNGKVLIAAGFISGVNPKSAEIYDPATGTFTATIGNMIASRGWAAAIRLVDGRVLISGGQAGDIVATAEIYDPTSDQFSSTGSMAIRRHQHTMTVLVDGSVLVAGGASEATVGSYVLPLATMERFISGTGTFIPAGGMEARRIRHTATMLPSNKVLIAGGFSQSWMTGDTAELYDIATVPALSPTALPDGQVGTPYPTTILSGAGGSGGPYAITKIAGVLPPGLDVAAATISGTPTANGVFTFGVQVTDSASNSNVQALTIRVGNLNTITSPYRLVDGELNHAYSLQLTATGTAPIAWSLAPASAIMPPGLAVSAAGVISGIPTTLGYYNFVIRAVDSSGQAALKTLSINILSPLTITTTALNDGVLFGGYGGCLGSSGGVGTRTWNVSAGSLPAGVALQTNGCFIGTVTALGTFNFTAQAMDQASPPATATQALSIAAFAQDQAVGSDNSQPTLTFGGVSGVMIAQRLIAGVSGTPMKFSVFSLSCPTEALVSVAIQGVAANGAPDGNTIASGSALFPFNNIALTGTPFFAADQTFTVVLSSSQPCSVKPPSFDANPGEGYVYNGTWQRLRDTADGRFDIPFAELIVPLNGLSYLTAFRGAHTATVLNDGRVLLTGAGGSNLVQAEIYDPANGSFAGTGSMSTPRRDHTATLLGDGTVLITGGWNSLTNTYVSSAEIFHPNTGTFELLSATLSSNRAFHTATLLSDGRVLIAGGRSGTCCTTDLNTAELYNPGSRTFSSTATMAVARREHTATRLLDNRVLVAGGWGTGNSAQSVEVFDPILSTFTTAAQTMSTRSQHTATLLTDGRALLAGGAGDNGNALSTAVLFDPVGGSFTSAGTMRTPRVGHTATRLADGSVLVAGGGPDNLCCDPHAPQAGADRYVLNVGWVNAGSLLASRYFHTASLVSGGRVLLAGAFAYSLTGRSAELYDPPAAVSLVNAALPDGNNGSTYPGATLAAQGGTGSGYTIAIAGILPPGLSYDSSLHTISGTPTQSGVFRFAVIVFDSGGHTNAQTLTIRIDGLDIAVTQLPNALLGSPYTAALTASGGVGSINWVLIPGSNSPPPGTNLASNGTVSGTPSSIGYYAFNVRATDSLGQTATRAVSIRVDPP